MEILQAYERAADLDRVVRAYQNDVVNETQVYVALAYCNQAANQAWEIYRRQGCTAADDAAAAADEAVLRAEKALERRLVGAGEPRP